MTTYISSLNIGEGFIEMILFDQIGDSINKGSKKFCDRILSFLNLELNVKSWSINLCRTNHFSDFIGEDDWIDNWQIVWKLKIFTYESIIPNIKLPDVFVEFDAIDDSWDFNESDNKDSETSCLIISYFLTEKDRKKVIRKISSIDYSIYNIKNNLSIPEFSESEIMDDYFQLTINLGVFSSEFYSNGANYAEDIINICKDYNGMTHYSMI